MEPNPSLTQEEISQSAYRVGDVVKVVNMRGIVLPILVLEGLGIGDTGEVVKVSTSRLTLRPYLVRGKDYDMYFGAENLRMA